MPNGIIIIDKPPAWTSHDVVGRLRRLLGEKRIGHAGTLDPMATGVLPVFVGRATRAVEFAECGRKVYQAGIRLGVTTDTQDSTGRVLTETPCAVTTAQLEEALEAFRGDILQVPPMYSALKVNGKKLYELARKGKEVERKPRPVTIYELELLEQTGADSWNLRIACSKGTYIRTLCHDIGGALGVGGIMISLRRTAAAGFDLTQAVTLEQVEQAKEAGRAEELLLPVDSYFERYPACHISGEAERRCRNGNDFPTDAQPGTWRVYGGDGTFLMLGESRNGIMHTVKSFFAV